MGTVNIMSPMRWLKMGIGKSYGTAVFCENIDPDFNINKVVYTPSETLKVFDYIEETGKNNQAFMIDEGEILAPASLYHSFQNKALFYIFSTHRYLKTHAFIVTPEFNWIDKRLRILSTHVGLFEKDYDTSVGRAVVDVQLRQIHTSYFDEKLDFSNARLQ
jgi:hypothetical protein